ncbi:MAG: mechanosensitive ion channel [Proteobacteria bacterium]|nr:mechanosensitive ion channel [Pseudomonadota bacterium]
MLEIFNLIKHNLPLIEASLASLVLGLISNWLLYKLINKYYVPTKLTPMGIIFSALRRAFYFILPLFYFSFFASWLNLSTTFHVSEILVKILFTIAFSLAAIKLLDYIDIWLERKRNLQLKEINFGGLITKAYLLKRILTTVIIFISLSLILLNFPSVKEVGKGILISATVVGGIIAFAAQKVFTNLFSGLDFILNRPISVGDTIAIGSEVGKIERITLNQIHLRTWDLRLIIYPLSYFNENSFQNLSHAEYGLKGTIYLFVDFSTNIDNLRRTLNAILEQSLFWDKKTNSLQVVEVTENNMQIRIVVGAKDFGELWDLRCEVREKLISSIQQKFPAMLPKNYIRLENINSKLPSVSDVGM